MARELGFQHSGMTVDAGYTLDIRGRSGVEGVRPFFKSVDAAIRVRTSEPEERLQQAREMTDSRCPMYNLLLAAGVELSVAWERELEAAVEA